MHWVIFQQGWVYKLPVVINQSNLGDTLSGEVIFTIRQKNLVFSAKKNLSNGNNMNMYNLSLQLPPADQQTYKPKNQNPTFCFSVLHRIKIKQYHI